MLEHARQFLERVMPGDIGDGAYLNIHWMGWTQDGRKFWDGRACTSIDEAVRTIAWANKMGDKDIYVCMSLQAKCENKTSGKGNAYKKAVRLADDVVALRSFYIDVDVKEDAYPDTNTALAALLQFVLTTGLGTPSAVVASGGGGFHVHWSVDTPLSRGEWQVLADALAEATRQHGLKTDSQCTIDSVRILRLPGTWNRKPEYEQPREVKLLSLGGTVPLEQIKTALSSYIGVTPSRAPKAHMPENDELGANLPVSKIELRVEDVAKQCGFIARSLGTGGRDNNQPLWFLSASIATFLEDGREALHAMSKDHPGYVPADTDRLFDRVSDTQKRRDLGWPKCQKIASSGCPDCASCPLLHHAKSPLNFAMPQKDVANDDTLPDRFFRNGDGVIHYRGVADDGTLMVVPLCHYPIMNGWLSNNPWIFHFTTRNEAGKKVVVEVPTEVIFAKDMFAKFLGSRGFFLAERQYKALKEFFVSWLQKLQQSKDRVVSSSPFGWSVVDGKIEGFAYGGRVWMADGDRPAANPNPQLQYRYTPKGNPEPWQAAAAVAYGQKRPGLDAILAVAFAAPLVRFTGFGGLLLNAFSPESGIGKTTTMKTSLAVWGSPTLAMQSLDDTANSILNTIGQLRALPVYWDEIKGADQTRKFCSTVFALTGGKEKSRLNADSTLRSSGTWQTMLVSASNASVIDGMAKAAGSTSAGLHRLFEFQLPPAPMTGELGHVQRLVGKLDDNYGHAGMAYAKFLGANWRRVEEEVAALQDKINTEINVQQEERMWAGTITVLLKGAQYANELGLTDIDVDALKDFLLGDVLMRMRMEVMESPTDMNSDISVSSILAEFLNSTRARNTLFTNRVWVGRGKPQKGAITLACDPTRLGDIAVHIGKEDRRIRISSIYLTRWMEERGYTRHTFVAKLEKEFGLVKMNGRLGGGTDLACATEHLLELDMEHPKLKQFVE